MIPIAAKPKSKDSPMTAPAGAVLGAPLTGPDDSPYRRAGRTDPLDGMPYPRIRKALIERGFKKERRGKSPSFAYRYPHSDENGKIIEWGNTEAWRFEDDARLLDTTDVRLRVSASKEKLWSDLEDVLMIADKSAPRLGIRALLDGSVNSVYIASIVYLSRQGERFDGHIVKFDVVSQAHWFELSPGETKDMLGELVTTVPEAHKEPFFSRVARWLGFKKKEDGVTEI